jgi:hypothetical protein
LIEIDRYYFALDLYQGLNQNDIELVRKYGKVVGQVVRRTTMMELETYFDL